MEVLWKLFLLAVVCLFLVEENAAQIPSARPTSKIPSTEPTSEPTGQPSIKPTRAPTVSFPPTPAPSSTPTGQPSSQPSLTPSTQPTSQPSTSPSSQPTSRPSRPTIKPTSKPSYIRTSKPTVVPSLIHTHYPTLCPSSLQPTISILPTSTSAPSNPTTLPSMKISTNPSSNPTSLSTMNPSSRPSIPSTSPTTCPSSYIPTCEPTKWMTKSPLQPTCVPSSFATRYPTVYPSKKPSFIPSYQSSFDPSIIPSPIPSISQNPTSQPTSLPSTHPTSQPTLKPTGSPASPTSQPTRRPSSQPLSAPTSHPSSQPTFEPTSPTSQPSALPSSQPFSVPSSQPSSQPSMQPTAKPTVVSMKPTIMLSYNPTISFIPTAIPTPLPTSNPSGQPSSKPTATPTISSRPSYLPTSSPTGQPSSQPTTSWGTSYTPTGAYALYNAVGSVGFIPAGASVCDIQEIQIFFTIYQNVTAGSQFIIESPGITSGPCNVPVNGNTIIGAQIYDDSRFQVNFYEGTFTNSFQDSYFLISAIQYPIVVGVPNRIIIDRSNNLKKSCVSNTTWNVLAIRPNFQNTHSLCGHLKLNDNFASECFFYNSSLEFTAGSNPQFPTGFNISLFPAFVFDSTATFFIQLPSVTNKLRDFALFNFGVNNSNTIGDIIQFGHNESNLKVTWNTSFPWEAKWVEGNKTYHPFNTSYLMLIPLGSFSSLEPFWIYIDKSNYLIPLCGNSANYSGFTIRAESNIFYTANVSFISTDSLGPGCSHLNNCNGNGQCDYCHSRCICNNGFGSPSDKLVSVSNNFKRDCSSAMCPLGPAKGIGKLSYNDNMHRLVECSNNGICNRETAKCECFGGYQGLSCDRMTCGYGNTNEVCSGRGKCQSMMELATNSLALPLRLTSSRYERSVLDNYYAWDSNLGYGCVCDSSWGVGLGANQTQLAEFFGPSCEFRRCPSGDDPMTQYLNETNCHGLSQTNGDVGEVGNLCHVDCSNRGNCNFQTGECICYEGFQGVNCGTISKYPGLLTDDTIIYKTRLNTNN